MNAKIQQLLDSYNLTVEDVIHVVMYLRPEIYMNSALVTASVNYDAKNRRYHQSILSSFINNHKLTCSFIYDLIKF